jgi:hypothetical protein
MEDIMTPQEDINLENDFKMADKKPKYKGKGKELIRMGGKMELYYRVLVNRPGIC